MITEKILYEYFLSWKRFKYNIWRNELIKVISDALLGVFYLYFKKMRQEKMKKWSSWKDVVLTSLEYSSFKLMKQQCWRSIISIF